MAKLSSHGREIGRVVYTTSIKAYFEDGKVLKNAGFGWKVAGKVKPEFTPASAFENASRRQAELLEKRPALAAYRKELHALAGISKRWKLHAAIELMPEDADGVWSEVCDGYSDNVHADVNEIDALCRLYLAACAEMKANRETIEA